MEQKQLKENTCLKRKTPFFPFQFPSFCFIQYRGLRWFWDQHWVSDPVFFWTNTIRKSANWTNRTQGKCANFFPLFKHSEKEKKDYFSEGNAISWARKLNCQIFVLPEILSGRVFSSKEQQEQFWTSKETNRKIPKCSEVRNRWRKLKWFWFPFELEKKLLYLKWKETQKMQNSTTLQGGKFLVINHFILSDTGTSLKCNLI